MFLVFFCWIIINQLPDNNYHLIVCDVGQGDSILLTYKSFQLLTDGGPPNGKVEKCLNRHMPFWDREIEVVVNTHPQLDHYGGLIKIFENYKVNTFMRTNVNISTKEYEVLEKVVGSEGTNVVNAIDGTSIRYDLILYDVFWPIENVNPTDSNDLSVQAILEIEDFEAILTGDIGNTYRDKILEKLPKQSVDYIKVPHHGSRNTMLVDYLREFMPKIAVISVGKDNSFGHPAPEVIKLLRDKDIKFYRTDEKGDVEIVTNGKEFWMEN